MSEPEQHKQVSVTSDRVDEFNERELIELERALSTEHVIDTYNENNDLTQVVISGLEFEMLKASRGYAPELVRCAPFGLFQFWFFVNEVCRNREWNWSRESPSLTYCKIYARPVGVIEPYVRIDIDVAGGVETFNLFDASNPITRDKWIDATSFIKAMKDIPPFGMDFSRKVPFLESDFEYLINPPDSTVDARNEREPTRELAKRLHRHPARVARWYRIIDEPMPQYRTQALIAEIEDVNVETIKDDYRDMRKAGLFPPLSHP